jgi:hypothetical protein
MLDVRRLGGFLILYVNERGGGVNERGGEVRGHEFEFS